jgi:YidC/Oxa1 family membrane protein insertase
MLIAENTLFHDVGQIFQPLLKLVGGALALIYGIIPNYAVAIALLTVIIMALLTPLTVKSTKSMMAMQRLQPEIKRLQQKYKGAENRQKLNEEMMALYKEQGVSPVGGCLPMFLQMPFLLVFYDVIRGLTNTVEVHGKTVAQPRYIPKPPTPLPDPIPLIDRMYHNLVINGGHMVAFGIDLSLKPFSHGLTFAQRIPFFALVAVAVGLQYVLMRQMNSRNPQAAANTQMQTIQKITPILFAYIYFIIPAAALIYMIVSTIVRIATQHVMLRMGIVSTAKKPRVEPGSVPTAAAGLVEGETAPPKADPPKGNGKLNGKAKAPGTTWGSTEGKAANAHPRSRAKKPRKAR